MSLALASFLGGAGAGYINAQRYADEKARQAKMDQIALDTAAFNKTQQQRTLAQQQALSQAAQPAQVDVGAGGMTKPAYADDSDVGQPGEPGADNGGLVPGALVNGQPAADGASALSAAKAYDDPAARLARQSDVMEKFQPGSGIALQNAALKSKQGQFAFTKDQAEYARTLRNEGALDTARALVGGDPQEIKDAFNRSGDWKIVGQPDVKKRDRTDIPGIDSLPTYDTTVTLKGPDGQAVTKTVNSYDFATHIMPYADFLGQQIKGGATDNLAEYRSGLVDVKSKLADLQSRAAEDRANTAALRLANMPTEQERKAWQGQMQDASRSLIEVRKGIAKFKSDNADALRRDTKKTGPEWEELNGMQQTMAQYQKDHDVSTRALAGMFGGGATPGPSRAAEPPAQPGVSGAFDLKDPALQAAIDDIKDPQERSNARAALAQQQAATPPTTTAANPAPLAMPQRKQDLKTGATYQTSRGPAKWNGTAFEQ